MPTNRSNNPTKLATNAWACEDIILTFRLLLVSRPLFPFTVAIKPLILTMHDKQPVLFLAGQTLGHGRKTAHSLDDNVCVCVRIHVWIAICVCVYCPDLVTSRKSHSTVSVSSTSVYWPTNSRVAPSPKKKKKLTDSDCPDCLANLSKTLLKTSVCAKNFCSILSHSFSLSIYISL